LFAELRARLGEVFHGLARQKESRIENPGAGQQEREDIKKARSEWEEWQKDVQIESLVFIEYIFFENLEKSHFPCFLETEPSTMPIAPKASLRSVQAPHLPQGSS
jgi:hypothetical protein